MVLERFCLAFGDVSGKGSEPEGVVKVHVAGKRKVVTTLDVCRKQMNVTASPANLTFLGYS
jgi:hypothetical protein